MFKMTDMENVYSSERRNAAPKVVMFRTAATSIVLVGTLTTISELLSFAYFRIVEIEQVLCFVWQGVIVSCICLSFHFQIAFIHVIDFKISYCHGPDAELLSQKCSRCTYFFSKFDVTVNLWV